MNANEHSRQCSKQYKSEMPTLQKLWSETAGMMLYMTIIHTETAGKLAEDEQQPHTCKHYHTQYVHTKAGYIAQIDALLNRIML